MRANPKSWLTLGVVLSLALCLTGCEGLFPSPVYTPPPVPPAPPPAALPPPVARVTLYVAGDRLNLRACPGMDCPRIAILERNEEVEKVGDAADWAQIRVKRDGTIGWVASRFLSPTPLTAPPAAAPSVPPGQVTPPPLPEIPEPMRPAPAKHPAVEKPAVPGEVPEVPPTIRRKPEELPPAKPARPASPVEEIEEVEEPRPVRTKRPAPAPPEEQPAAPEKPAAPAEPAPEKPSGIRIM